jgi:formyltetrahydrofolate synthetase
VPSYHWGEGGKGAIELAKAVVETCNSDKQRFRYLYDLNSSIEEKISIISKEIYGADGIELSEDAQKKIALYKSQVFPLPLNLRSRDSGNCRSVSLRPNIHSQPTPMPKVYLLDLKSRSAISEFLEVPDSSLS